MRKTFYSIICLLLMQQICFAEDPKEIVPPSLIFELLALNGDLETVQRPRYLSPSSMEVSPDGKFIYIGARTAKQVLVFSVSSNSVTKSFPMPNEPTGIAVSGDGSRLYVTCSSERWPNGMVCVVNVSSGTIEQRISAGHMARSPVLSPDGDMLYVCNWMENSISFINVVSAREEKRVPAIKEPYSMALSGDGAFLLVANMIPDGIATDTAMTCKVCFIDTKTGSIKKTLRLPTGSHSTMNICLTPDKKYAFIPHLIGRVSLPAVTLDQGWVHSNNLAIIDMEKQDLYNDVELDDNRLGFANPWDVACTDDGKWLCVAHAGYDVLTVVDMPAMFEKLKGKGDVSHEFTFIQDLKRTLVLRVRSPRSVAVIGSKAYTVGYFSNSIESVDLNAASLLPQLHELAPEKALTAERKGESYFYDANLCVGHWQSCHSCHPFTRPDGLNWILSDSYLNSPKNAKSMLHTFQTPPTNWTGRRNDAFESVRAGIRLELQVEPSAEVAVALDTFLLRLKPVPSPKLVKGRLSESAQRGREIYYDSKKLDCIHCHPAPLFTNLKNANAGVVDIYDPRTEWDTPSIIECWRTGPYNHLGSHETIEEIVLQPGHSKNVKALTSEEFRDLIEYILSL